MNSLFEKEQVIESVKQSFVKLDPRQMIKNPIMFTVEICTAIMLPVTLYSAFSNEQGSFAYNVWVFFILFIKRFKCINNPYANIGALYIMLLLFTSMTGDHARRPEFLFPLFMVAVYVQRIKNT